MTGKFLKIQCAKCNNEQNIYQKASTEVKCLVCNEIIARNTASIAELTQKAKVLKVLE